MTTRVLFVDENRDILEAFKRVLYKMRKKWDIEFAVNGEEALEKLEKEQFNVIVCSLDLRGISGIEFFEIVKGSEPEAIRIFVSANMDLKPLVESLGLAHQFLLKPVDPLELKETLTRVLDLQEWVNSASLKKIIHQIGSFPTPPEIYSELLQAITTCSIKEIAKVVEQNPGIAARLLQLANTPYFGRKGEVNNITEAIMILGIDILKGVVIATEAFSKFHPATGQAKKELVEIFKHSVEVANLARLTVMEITGDRTVANIAYTGGLVHDIGKLILLSHFPEYYFKIKNSYIQNQFEHWDSKGNTLSVSQFEKELLGVDHAQLGGYLLGLWGLPEMIIEIAAYHHRPEAYFYETFSVVTAVHIGNSLQHGKESFPNQEIFPGLNEDYINRLNLGEKLLLISSRVDESRKQPLF